MNQKIHLFTASWEKYLLILSVLISAGFLSSGVVTWIAANWDQFGKFTKLYAAQGLLVFSILAGLVAYAREYRKVGTVRLKFATATLFFIAAVLIGALLALIGQIYQTGADPWQLFAFWTLLQLPLLLALPNVAAALLLILTANTALSLYLNFISVYEISYYPLIGLNLLFVLAAERFAETLYDLEWRILSKVSNVVLIGTLLLFCFAQDELIVLTWLPAGGLLYYYSKIRSDLFNQSGYWAFLLMSLNILILKTDSFTGGSIFLALMSTLGGAIALAIHLKKVYQRYDNFTAMPWQLQLLFAGLALLSALLVVAFLLLSSKSFQPILLIATLLFLSIGIAGYYQKQNELIIGMLLIIGLTLGAIYLMVVQHRFYETSILFEQRAWLLLIFSATCLWCFAKIRINWLQSYSLIVLLATLFYWFTSEVGITYAQSDFTDDLSIEPRGLGYLIFVRYSAYWLPVCTLLLFYFSLKPSRQQHYLQAAAWGLLLFYLGFMQFELLEFSLVSSGMEATGNAVLSLSWADFWQRSLQALFPFGYWHLGGLLQLLINFSPLMLYLLFSKKYSLNKPSFIVGAVVLSLFCLTFAGSNSVLFGFSLLLLAYPNHHRVLFGIATLSLVLFLSQYYYWLGLPLLYKAFLLLVNGLLFALLAFTLQRQTRRDQVDSQTPKTEQTKLKIGYLTPALALFSLVSTLVLGNSGIQRYENVLNHGHSVILEMAPVDPRSLMQGDYMELNYALSNEIRTALEAEEEQQRQALNINYQDSYSELASNAEYEAREAAYAQFAEWQQSQPTTRYALLNQAENGVASLCRLESTLPQQYDGCVADIYFTIQVPDYSTLWLITLPGKQFFFAEGKGEHFAQAAYAEFRVLNGVTLLQRLLDSNLKPL